MGFEAVYTVVYNYSPVAEGELEIKEGDLLFILEKTADDGWWKAKKKAAEEDEEEPVGLVPNNYVEKAKPVCEARALYDYTRQTDEEVSFAEDAPLSIYDTSDPDWTLVGVNGEFGFAPANYIEITGKASSAQDARPAAPPRPQQPQHPADEESDGVPTPTSPASVADQTPAAALAGILHQQQSSALRSVPSPQTPRQPQLPARTTTYTPEASDDEAPPPTLPQRPLSQASPVPRLPAPREPSPPPRTQPAMLREEDAAGIQPSPPYNRVRHHEGHRSPISPSGYHLYNISEMISIMGKKKKMPTTLGINVATGTIFISPEKTTDGPHQEWTADKLSHYSIEGKHVFLDLIRPTKNVDFHAGAKDTALEIVSALGEIAGAYRAEGLREVIAAGTSGGRKKGQILYDFMAQGDDEVTVHVGDEVVILDDSKSDEWWMVRRIITGKEGVVPSSYVEITGVTSKSESSSGTNAGLSIVEQNRLEEQRSAKEMARKSRRVEFDDDYGTGERHQKRESRSEGKSKPKPNPSKVRKWTDRSGTFNVAAEFIGLNDGKIHLHKQNGVKIAVPVSKMSVEDLEYVEKATGESLDEDKPLSDIRRRSRLGGDASKTIGATVKGHPDYDWFEFFLKTGVGPHQCERYAQNFTKDSMDESVLPDITPDVLRTLGMKEGDILRVMKYLDTQFGRTGAKSKPRNVSFGGEEVMGDNEEQGSGSLFSGPGGALRNNTRKGRPAPAVQTSDVVDAKVFESKDESAKPASPIKVASPVAEKETTKGFEDDAWEVKTPRQPATSMPVPAPATTQAAPASQPPATQASAPLVGAMADLNLLQNPLQPTVASPTTTSQPALPIVSQPTAQPQQPQQQQTLQPQATGANPAFFSQLGQQNMQQGQQQMHGFTPQMTGFVQQQQPPPQVQMSQPVMPPRQRPQPPPVMTQGSSLLPPPPQRPLSAPQNMPQQSAFGPPAPLQPQLTGIPLTAPQVAPPGHSLAELNQQQHFQPQFGQQQHLQPHPTGFVPGQNMGQFGTTLGPQPTGMMPQQFNMQTSQPGFQQQSLAPHPTGFMSMPQQQPQQHPPMSAGGINSVLPPPLHPQRTGINGAAPPTFTPSPPPIPPIPQQPTAAPLQPQKTGPPPPVRFGVRKDAPKIAPQPTGLRANLAQATNHAVNKI
ncbi:hypothetical protein AJ80_07879 [Polytolypa hystricis UAMH7299]|uniref:Actin cytoskeleton-regulatory complex protein SLA1 n=1 Tax=Polytolypa hystricis (strain UAMH7299) TaxID=1447883 RepID=A0A2B7XHN5_POLH7|nr:hypothetical protein AJ80_07879 [Polytolypa hystricis UAMH7299]